MGRSLLGEGTRRGVAHSSCSSRELGLHCTPSPAVPVSSRTLPAAPVVGRRSGRVCLTPMSASAPVSLHAAPFGGKALVWCAPGGRSSEAQARAGGGRGGWRPCVRFGAEGALAYTLRCASSSTGQSDGLLIRRFRVRIPRGAPKAQARPIDRRIIESHGRQDSRCSLGRRGRWASPATAAAERRGRPQASGPADLDVDGSIRPLQVHVVRTARMPGSMSEWSFDERGTDLRG